MDKIKRKAIIVSGYFNPVHKGHLELFQKSKEKGDFLIVIINSDLQRKLKGSKIFQDENERLSIISSIKYVNKAIISIDKDKTQISTIKYLHNKYNTIWDLYFANCGDQDNNSIPERKICKDLNISLIDGLGNKIQSSSWLLKNT